MTASRVPRNYAILDPSWYTWHRDLSNPFLDDVGSSTPYPTCFRLRTRSPVVLSSKLMGTAPR